LAHAFRWEYSYKRLELAQLLGQLGIFLTCPRFSRSETDMNFSASGVADGECTANSTSP
jgi:hypothetical protein